MFLVLIISYNVRIRESFILNIYPKCIDVRQTEFIVNETGTQRHATTITNSKLVDPTAVVQFTNLAKTVPISNPVQIRLNLDQPSATSTTAATTGQGATNEIAALPP